MSLSSAETGRADHVSSSSAISSLNVAYVMTHYPRIATTFLSDEINALERIGAVISPVVMNLPSARDLTTSEAIFASSRTLYLKASLASLGGATLRAFAAHPWKMLELVGTAVRSARLDPKLAFKRLAHLSYATLAWQHARSSNIRHLHAHFGLAPATIAWFAASIANFERPRNCTWSFTIHGYQDFTEESDARLDLKAAAANFVVCVSDFTRAQLCRVTEPALWSKFHVIRCGIDLKSFPLRQPRPFRAVPRVIMVGRLSPEKGHLILFHAIRLLKDTGIEVMVEVVGAGPYLDYLQREQERLELQANVVYVGELLPAEVSFRLAKADIFCMPSFSEGLPISIMEAMAIGIPVITTFIGGIPELAVHEATALVVPASNSGALAAALKRLIEDEPLRQRLVESGRAAVEHSHDIEFNIRELWREFDGARTGPLRELA